MSLPKAELPTAKKRANDTDSELSDALDSSDEDEDQKEQSTAVQKIYVTAAMAEKWHRRLVAKPDVVILEKVVKAFQAAVTEAAGHEEDTPNQYKVEGIVNFNAVVRTCLRCFPVVFVKLLNYEAKGATLPSSCKRWGALKMYIRIYLSSLSILLRNLASPDVMNAVLKHTTQLTKFITCFPKQTRVYLKLMINIWSTGDDASRILAFISIIRMVRLKQEDLLEKTLKTMYMAYIRNCKFTSPTLLPSIGFMQHSLVEIFSLEPLLGYQYTFVYIRQLAIHLRNAMASKKKDSYQAVYNWQYIHSCAFLSRLVAASYSTNDNMKQLLYPLVQVIIGCIRLIPTARYFPLRFQCIRMLNLLSQKTGVYIPTLTILLEVLEVTDFKKKMARVNTKPLDFSCILKLSKTQTQERGFKDGLMDNLYELILDHLVSYAHTISFPEMVVPAVFQMKHFVKTCKIANFTKQIKQLLLKITETSTAIQQRRKTSSIDLSDTAEVSEWEHKSKSEGTPIGVYYKKYRALRDREVMLGITGKEQMEEYDNTPLIPTGQQRRATETERVQFSSLFDKEDSSDDDNEQRFSLEKPKKSKKNATGSSDDDASSLNSEELALLDEDASDDDDGDGDDSDLSDSDSDQVSELEDESVASEVDDNLAEDVLEDLELSDVDE